MTALANRRLETIRTRPEGRTGSGRRHGWGIAPRSVAAGNAGSSILARLRVAAAVTMLCAAGHATEPVEQSRFAIASHEEEETLCSLE